MDEKNVVSNFAFEDKNFKLLKPSSQVLREAKFIHSKSFTQVIQAGLFTRRKLEGVLKQGEVNVIDDYNVRKNELLRLYNETKDLTEGNNNPKQLEDLVELLTIYRDRIIQEDLSMNSVFSNTADQIAEDDRVNYLVSELILNTDGTKVWNTLEDFLKDSNYEFTELCKYHVICWSYNMNPEAMNLSKVELEILNKASSIRKENEKLKASKPEGKKEKVKPVKKAKSKTAKNEISASPIP